MLGRITIAVLAFGLWGIASAPAQDALAVSKILQAGGRVLTRDEVLAAFTGAMIAGRERRGDATFQMINHADHSITGTRTSRGQSITIAGTWTVSPEGVYCVDLKGSTGGATKACSVYLLLAGSYYSARNAEPDEQALLRTITR